MPNEWRKEMWEILYIYIHSFKGILVSLKKEGSVTCYNRFSYNLEDIMSETSPSQKDKYYVVPLI